MQEFDISYKNNGFRFIYRASAIIYNEDKTKVLLTTGADVDYYLLLGGKIKEQENSLDAVKREIEEEIGFKNIDFKYSGISEELVKVNENIVQQIEIIYEGVYLGKIKDGIFNGLENDWCKYEWVDINYLEKYSLKPKELKKFIINKQKIKNIKVGF